MRENLPVMKKSLLDVLVGLGIKTDFTLELRGYSKSYNGLYYPEKRKVVLYVRDVNGKIYSRKRLLRTLIHEAVHHYQFVHDDSYVRIKGVMHDHKFKRECEFYYAMLEEREMEAV